MRSAWFLRAVWFAGVLCAAACNRDSPSGRNIPSTLVVALNGDPGAMNPAVTTSGSTHPVTDQIFNGLVGLDERLAPVPELAERWNVEEDGRAYRFALRRGVTWHDGQPFTSADVKFTFEQALLKYHSRTRAALQDLLERVDTPDEHTAIFRLKRPYSPLLQRLDVVEASIIPQHIYSGQDLLAGEATRRPIGTGPFRFVSYTPADRVVLERNPAYFRTGLPGVDRLVFRIMPNAGTAVAALEKGEVDYVGSVAGPEVERLRQTPGIAIVSGTGGSGGSICEDVLIPNLSRAPFGDLRVRRAIAMALDRQFIVDHVYFGQGRPATGPISHLLAWAYTPDVRQYPHDLAAAARLLDEAGLKSGRGGERFAITFTHASTQQRLAQAVREQLKAVGITVNLETLDFNAGVDRVYVKKNFDLGMASFCNGADPDIGVRRVYVSTNIGPFPFSNGAGYRNPRVDELFDEATRFADRDERRARYVEIQKLLADDVPYFWIIDSEGLRAHRTAFTGFRLWTGAFVETVQAGRSMTPSPSNTRWLLRRFGLAAFVVVGVATLTFILIHAAPGDPIYVLAGDGGSPEYYADMRAKYGLDRPLLEQFGRYARAVAVADFGYSFMYQAPVVHVLVQHAPASLLLGFTALVLATCGGFTVGAFAGARPNGAFDQVTRALASVTYSAPVFWIGQMLIILIAVKLRLLPAGGFTSARDDLSGLPYAIDVATHLVLPAVALSLPFMAVVSRVARAAIADALREPLVLAARARGLTPRRVLMKHAAVSALVPVIALVGEHAAGVVAGAALTEALFGWPGLGYLVLHASLHRDYPLVTATFIVISSGVVFFNAATEVACSYVDPRVTLS